MDNQIVNVLIFKWSLRQKKKMINLKFKKYTQTSLSVKYATISGEMKPDVVPTKLIMP